MNEIFEGLEEQLPKTDQALNALKILAGTRTVEVELPILKTKVKVSPIDGAEDLILKTLKSSGATFIHSFNELLFKHCKFDGIEFEGVKDFEDHLTPPDKQLIVYALLNSTFNKLPEKTITCPHCKTSEVYSAPPEAMFHQDTIQKVWDKVDFESYEIMSEVVPGLQVFYSMPTETDKLLLLESKTNGQMREDILENDDVFNTLELFSVYIKKLIIKHENGDIVLTDKVNEIIPTINGMPLELKAALLKDETVSEFTEYAPKFYLNLTCDNRKCNRDFTWDEIDPEQDFFRKALSVYN